MSTVPDDLVGSFCAKEIAVSEDNPDWELDLWIPEAVLGSHRSWRAVHEVFERHELDSITGAVPVVHQAHEVHEGMDLVRVHRWLAPLIPILRKLFLQPASPQSPEHFLEDAIGDILCGFFVGVLPFEPVSIEPVSF